MLYILFNFDHPWESKWKNIILESKYVLYHKIFNYFAYEHLFYMLYRKKSSSSFRKVLDVVAVHWRKLIGPSLIWPSFSPFSGDPAICKNGFHSLGRLARIVCSNNGIKVPTFCPSGPRRRLPYKRRGNGAEKIAKKTGKNGEKFAKNPRKNITSIPQV